MQTDRQTDKQTERQTDKQKKVSLVYIPNQHICHFSVETTICGKVHVTVHDENDTFVQSLEPKDISEIVKSVKDHNLLPIPDFVDIDGRSVCVTSTGRCEFIYGKEQHVTTAQD